MNRLLKKLLLGLLIWGIPFFASILVWDVEAGMPKISMAWFSALMAFTWAVGFAIAVCVYFKDVKSNTVAEGWATGLTWYVELLVLDLIFLVGLFGMAITDLYPMVLTYLSNVAISAAVGYAKR